MKKNYSLQLTRLFTQVAASIIVIMPILTGGCTSGELSRSQVKAMVEASPDFAQPSTVDLTNQYEIKPADVNKLSADETVEQAKTRDLKTLLESYPAVDVARLLGYVNIVQALIKEDPYVSGTMSIPSWYLTRQVRANEAGKQLWNDLKLPVRDDALPISMKQFGVVSGITKQGETQALADFTYQWQPNEFGKALDEKNEKFKKLPEEIRKALSEKKGLSQVADSMDWSGERQGKALFQKYDDGWRLVRIFNL